MKVESNFPLKELNTYKVDVRAKYFASITTFEDLLNILHDPKYKDEKKLILGGGSNILFTKDFDGLLIKMELKGKEILKEDKNAVYIKMAAGENWDEFVHWAVENNYEGIENMALIPGTVGGAASQNIAAYGQNVSEVVEEITAIEVATGKEKVFSKKECQFTYRHSRFKIDERGKYCIVSVLFKLQKHFDKLETSYHERKGRYGSLEEELQSFAKAPYTMKDVMEAVIRQRTKRLPSLDEYGCCGSVFENPVVTVEKYNELAKKISDLQSYPFDKLDYSRSKWDQFEEGVQYVKIPAGRLLDELGWRGKWIKEAGVSEKHALCVVTRDGVSGKEVLAVINAMRKSVKDSYGVELEAELNII